MKNHEGRTNWGRKGGSSTSDAKKLASQANGKRGGRPKDGMRLLRKFLRKNRLDLGSASDGDLKQVWSALLNTDGQYMFWVGDVLTEIARRHGQDAAKLAIKDSPEPQKFDEAETVCRAFGENRFNLSFKYHREVVAELGSENGAEVIRWLRLAEQNRWPITEMRRQIRRSKAIDGDRVKEPRTLTITTELKKLALRIKSVVTERPVDSWSLSEVTAFLDDAGPIAEMIDEARERLA